MMTDNVCGESSLSGRCAKAFKYCTAYIGYRMNVYQRNRLEKQRDAVTSPQVGSSQLEIDANKTKKSMQRECLSRLDSSINFAVKTYDFQPR